MYYIGTTFLGSSCLLSNLQFGGLCQIQATAFAFFKALSRAVNTPFSWCRISVWKTGS
jgi:hypothetical protein